MAAPAILKIDIITDATKAIKALNDTGDAAQKTGGSFKSAGKVIGGALGTAAVISFGKASFTAAEESAVATARLEQVFASMGDTTGKAAKAAEQYAGALSKKIGVDDEAIMAAQAQLATFGAVSNEVARGAGIFDRATAAAADLAAAGFGTLDSNSVQLGKALQDPTKGLTALAKSGVTFTEQQKDQIAAMQKSGDLLGAQKVVLAAVEGQVKGTAAATVTNTQKMKVAFGELQETIGGKLAPSVNALTGFMADHMAIILPVAGVILGIVAAMKLAALAEDAWTVAKGIGTAAQWLWNAAVSANPIMLIVIAVAAVIAILVLAYQKVGWFRAFVDASMRAIVGAFNLVVDAAGAVFGWISDHWPLLLAILLGPFGILLTVVIKNFDEVKNAAAAAWDFITNGLDALAAVIRTVAGAITAPFREAFNAIAGLWNRSIGALKFTVPDWVPGIGGKGWEVPNMPTLARGGMVARTGLALVHEGERFSGVGRSGFGGTSVTINISTTGLGADAPQIQRAVVNALRAYTTRNGPLDVPVRAFG